MSPAVPYRRLARAVVASAASACRVPPPPGRRQAEWRAMHERALAFFAEPRWRYWFDMAGVDQRACAEVLDGAQQRRAA